MNAILTHVVRDKKTKKQFVEAYTASGKKHRHTGSDGLYYEASDSGKKHRHTGCLYYSAHLCAAKTLSDRLGWGSNLVGGETKDGFAFIPVQEPQTTQDQAASILERVAEKFQSNTDPRHIAWAIKDLGKNEA